MKSLITLVLILNLTIDGISQTNSSAFPIAANLKTIHGENFNSANISNDGKPVIVDFWGTFCKPCIVKYNSLAKKYEQWQKEFGVKIYAVSIDDESKAEKVKELANKFEWPFEILLDQEKEFFHQFTNSNSVPKAYFFDGEFNLIDNTSGAKLYLKSDSTNFSLMLEKLYSEDVAFEDFDYKEEDFYKLLKQITEKSNNEQ